MSDLTSLSGSMGNLSSLPGVGGTSMGIGASLTGAGQGAQGGQSALQELAGMLAEMLLGSGSGSGSGSGAGGGQSACKGAQGGQSDLDSLLQSLQGNGQNGDSQTKGSSTAGGGEKELLTQVLMALFEKILGGSDSSSGAATVRAVVRVVPVVLAAAEPVQARMPVRWVRARGWAALRARRADLAPRIWSTRSCRNWVADRWTTPFSRLPMAAVRCPRTASSRSCWK